MFGEMRFYCRECDKVIDRRQVNPKTYEEGFRCRWCGSTVYRTRKLLARLFREFVDWLIKHDEDMEKYE